MNATEESPSMTHRREEAIDAFFAAVAELKQVGVIRSNKYLGDIAEFLCCNFLHMELAANKTQNGHDGVVQGFRCQVKFSGGSSTTIDLGDPTAYERLIIVLGPESVLRPTGSSGRWILYNIPKEVVMARASHTDGVRRFTKNQIPQDYLVGCFTSLTEAERALEYEAVGPTRNLNATKEKK
jgi:hypothetical protein